MTTRDKAASETVGLRVLTAALASDGRVLLLGDAARVAQLERFRADLFVSADSIRDRPLDRCQLLVLGLEPEALRRAEALGRDLGVGEACAVVELRPGARLGDLLQDARERLHAAGWTLVGHERLAWSQAAPTPGGSRLDRLDAETSEVLLRLASTESPETVRLLEEQVLRLQHRFDLYAQLEVDHAATREVERVRAGRLRELETQLQRLRGLDLAAEVERLRAELELIQATRLWRLGARWWRLKARFQRGAG